MLRDNPRVHDTRQTENLRENWILRQRNRECNNSPFVISRWFSWGKTGNEKAVWCVQTALKQKKWWPLPGSNRGHMDFQSIALPTELSCHILSTKLFPLGMFFNISPIFYFSSRFLQIFTKKDGFHRLFDPIMFNSVKFSANFQSTAGWQPRHATV